MRTKRSRWCPQPQHGYTLLYAVAMSTLLLFSVLAFLKWSINTRFEGRRQVAEVQAYYTAQAAIIQGPLSYLRNNPPRNLTWPAVIAFNDGWIAGMGRYVDSRITVLTEGTSNYANNFTTPLYDCTAIGIATYHDVRGKTQEVRRRVIARVHINHFNSFFYFTDNEQTRFGEFIWFFGGDSIFGRLHSNSDIGIHPGAYFGGFVTTTGMLLSHEGSTFAGKPAPGYFEHVKKSPIPVRADRLRAAAASGGNWLNTSDNQYTYGLWFHGSAATVWRWRSGTPFPPYLDFAHTTAELSWSSGTEHAIFCDGDLWICGSVHGLVGIGAAGNLRLMDNIIYSQSYGYPYSVWLGMTDEVTLVSEAAEPGSNRYDQWTGILIANTPANGRDNGMHLYNSGDEMHRDIAIHGQLFALNSSFTFEQQNDSWDPYQGPSPDERGYIYLTGAICQHRRGYLHRANHNSTGYFKSFRYDRRFETNSPPFTVDLTSAGGMRLSIEGWYDDYANRKDIGEAPYQQKYPALDK